MQLLETSRFAKQYMKSLSSSKASTNTASEVERVNELQKTIRYLTNQNKATSILLGGSDIWQSYSNDSNNNMSGNKTRDEMPVEALVSKMNETLPNVETLKKNTIDSHYKSIVDLLNVATGNANSLSFSSLSAPSNSQVNTLRLASQPKSSQPNGYNLFVNFFTTYKESQNKEINIQAVSQFLSSNNAFTVEDYYKMKDLSKAIITDRHRYFQVTCGISF
ncbi:hypothetical protein ACO0QE_001345 [Hanseniaspora vineae]